MPSQHFAEDPEMVAQIIKAEPKPPLVVESIVTGGCVVCGSPDDRRGGRCMACYQYRRRTGQDRTWEQIAKANAKAIDRALALALAGRIAR